MPAGTFFLKGRSSLCTADPRNKHTEKSMELNFTFKNIDFIIFVIISFTQPVYKHWVSRLGGKDDQNTGNFSAFTIPFLQAEANWTCD